jgi:hypothetical protein
MLSAIEKSALELMLREKLGSGVGTSALLKVLMSVVDSYVPPYESIPVADLEPVLEVDELHPVFERPEVVVTESSP